MQFVFKGEDGLEMIVHAGLDTVELNGKYYEAHVNTGDHVKAGDVCWNLILRRLQRQDMTSQRQL